MKGSKFLTNESESYLFNVEDLVQFIDPDKLIETMILSLENNDAVSSEFLQIEIAEIEEKKCKV